MTLIVETQQANIGEFSQIGYFTELPIALLCVLVRLLLQCKALGNIESCGYESDRFLGAILERRDRAGVPWPVQNGKFKVKDRALIIKRSGESGLRRQNLEQKKW